ncbi:MAG TPA: NAD(P)H-hydrate epimerase [Anaerolineae bacterium]|nr:NAD(P)H-hydrate epimerase [Anaerolineae bacterium]
MPDQAQRLVFRTEDGVVVPSVTADEKREVDPVAVEEFGLSILQMMENAGRNLAQHALEMLGGLKDEVTILAGAGGNGGGGMCCARHLHNRGLSVWVILASEEAALSPAAHNQLRILRTAGIEPVQLAEARACLSSSLLAVDALVGYGLRGAATGGTAHLIDLCYESAERVLSLDVPSGVDATTGESPGPAVQPHRTLTLALPKTGLRRVRGELYLADIGIPPEVFHRLGLQLEPPFKATSYTQLEPADGV